LVSWNEELLFEWLKDKVYYDLLKSKNQMSRWDCYSPYYKHRIELKCRRTHYDTLLLEKKKYDAMISETSKHLDIPMYINSTPEGIYAFNLGQLVPVWEEKRLRASTDFGRYEVINKQVMFINVSDATVLL